MEASHAAPVARAGGVAHVMGQIRAERLRFIFMRLSFAGVLLFYALFLAWALPWTSFGMSAGDYDGRTAISLLLMFAAFFTSLAFVIVWGPHFRHETLPEFLRVLFGASQLIRSSQQFHSRLAAVCRKAQKDRRQVFSVIVVQLAKGNGGERQQPEDPRRLAAVLVRSSTRAEDVVGDSWPREVWVLSAGVDHEARESIIRRLAHALVWAGDEGQPAGACRIGGSTFGRDGEQSQELFGAAYGRLAPLAQLLDGHDRRPPQASPTSE